jgi:hypothetical protein
MRTSAKLGLTALIAAFLLSSAISTASARTFSTTENSVRATWSTLEFVTPFATIRCRVTLEGSFHSRTIPKVFKALIGAITRAIVAHPCTGGEAWADNGIEREPLGTAPNKLPYHITYESFAGNLPNISSVDILVSRFSFVVDATVLGLTCVGRYGTPTDNVTAVAVRDPATGGITEIAPVTGRNLGTLVEELGPNRVCPRTGNFVGRGTLANLTNGARITITLI